MCDAVRPSYRPCRSRKSLTCRSGSLSRSSFRWFLSMLRKCCVASFCAAGQSWFVRIESCSMISFRSLRTAYPRSSVCSWSQWSKSSYVTCSSCAAYDAYFSLGSKYCHSGVFGLVVSCGGSVVCL